ncbi:hypothetical protein [Natronorarus salvus]|uniref:hypothetical protein n=1 Tax=Natronorarus salvus TaxID=3117733 RepID=UPI002F25F275
MGGRRRPDRDGSEGPLDVEDEMNVFSRGLSPLVPARLARAGLSVSVETDREEYAVGDAVGITIEIRNRLPLPVEVPTEGRRIWGWTVDGLLAASDEPLYRSTRPNSVELRANQTITVERSWDGRFKRSGSPTRWVPAAPGEYEIGAFVATTPRTRDSTTVRLYSR